MDCGGCMSKLKCFILGHPLTKQTLENFGWDGWRVIRICSCGKHRKVMPS